MRRIACSKSSTIQVYNTITIEGILCSVMELIVVLDLEGIHTTQG